MAGLIPLPIGVTSRPLPDRYASQLAGGEVYQSGVGGQLSYVGVYNNAVDGSVLRIYSIHLAVSASSKVTWGWKSGNPGTLFTATQPYGAIDGRAGTLPGQLITLTSAVCVSTHIGGLSALTGAASYFAPGWPLAIIPPAYSFLVEVANVNTYIECGIGWLVMPGPLSPRV